VVKLDGLGKRFSGPYYVTQASHVYDAAEGYTTRFTVRRNVS
jgi:phage protein D